MTSTAIAHHYSSEKLTEEFFIPTLVIINATPSIQLTETAGGEMCRMRIDPSDGSIKFETNDGVGGGWVDAGIGKGDFVGPGSSTDNALVRFNGTTGKAGQNSLLVCDDSGVLSGAVKVAFGNSPTTGGTNSSVCGGFTCSITSAAYSFIGGGNTNLISSSGAHNVIVGGEDNTISGTQEHGFIGGGDGNEVQDRAGVICGGLNNTTSTGTAAFIGCGTNNLVSGGYSIVVGGNANTASGSGAVCIGGQTNTSTGSQSVVVGGLNCDSTGAQSAVIGGSNCNATANYAICGGGLNNNASATETVVVGGRVNTASATGAVVVGGDTNTNAANDAFIGGGTNNSIVAGGDHAVVCGGENNTITTNPSDDCVIVGGTTNTITAGLYATIVGGFDNSISATGAFIGGGRYHDITSSFGIVGGGESNTASNNHAAVLGGESNTASGDGSSVGGGHDNVASGTDSCVPGGHDNEATANYSTAIGKEATTRSFQGALAYSSGMASARGDRQTRSNVMRGQSTTDTFVSLTADGGTDSSADTFQIPENSAARIQWKVLGVNSDGSEVGSYNVLAVVKRFSSTTTLVHSNVTVEYEDDAAWDVQVVTYSLGAALQAKGSSGETVNWCAVLESVEIV